MKRNRLLTAGKDGLLAITVEVILARFAVLDALTGTSYETKKVVQSVYERQLPRVTGEEMRILRRYEELRGAGEIKEAYRSPQQLRLHQYHKGGWRKRG